ncbi:VOC family protein [Micromonospora endophytica]|uniref:Glyoxalase-like domain-containing protein n=1 Tax=Micromonospora endophytica TaxID=515350 RepID=A0A2W2DE09_9ACTN|nr:VOC family protein [Micromonospora endophytica]PZF98077.1 hypothetical protein C1I93_09910 [Micromonospora endophytica]RIW49479.1 hypothetical protein D3H59_04315 [Micromonospora endophytica]BCJ62512.1 hypothetical protein Jiend_59340 [Micromonospora endophytica]
MAVDRPTFTGGTNIALKIPKFRFEATVAFYRDTLKLPYLGEFRGAQRFQFGPVRLWLDQVDNYSQTDVWLEVNTDDPDAAAAYLAESGVPVRDEIEAVEFMTAHWISDPAGVVHLVSRSDE